MTQQNESDKQMTKDLEEVFEQNKDPVEQERRRLKKNRENREKEKLKDLGI